MYEATDLDEICRRMEAHFEPDTFATNLPAIADGRRKLLRKEIMAVIKALRLPRDDFDLAVPGPRPAMGSATRRAYPSSLFDAFGNPNVDL